MTDISDDRKEPSDAGPTPQKKDDKVTGRSSKRKSQSNRKSLSAISSPLKLILDKEKADAADKIKRYFEKQTVNDRETGRIGYKVNTPVKIDGNTYQRGEFVPLEAVEAWSTSPDDGEPAPEKDPDAEDFKDSGDPDDPTSNTYPSPLEKDDPYWC